MNFKSGFVSIIGSPNVGKSTLLNALLNEKIAAVSPKPQTTRTKITGIVTDDEAQIIFLDTPGIQNPKNKLGSYMKNVTDQTAMQTDIVVYMIDGSKYNIQKETDVLQKISQPITFLLINKIDKIKKADILNIIAGFSAAKGFSEIIPISAQKKEGIENLLSCIKKYLPEGPKFFPDDMITDQPERQICAELIREKMMRLLGEEIPYGTAVVIDKLEYNEAKDITTINGTIYCERQSHKGIIIGKGGAMLKKIGSQSRADLQRFLDGKVFLQLWVKVLENWRNSAAQLKNFGYTE
ncbi:MAG: GTPase Era [Firmicutes bacterium]|nr:GTPase Era [Bacillota bacterium]